MPMIPDSSQMRKPFVCCLEELSDPFYLDYQFGNQFHAEVDLTIQWAQSPPLYSKLLLSAQPLLHFRSRREEGN